MASDTRISAGGLVPLAPPSIQTVDGFVGVFTPIAPQGKTSPDATQNLEEIIDRLTTELRDLAQKNADLQNRIDTMLAPVRSPDDVATALRQTVDRIQSELGSLSNPISNFAVKDFRLETSLAVAITELGLIEYRLLQPGANVDPNAVSKLTLSLVPIEKKPEGTLAPAFFQPNRDLAVLGMSDQLLGILQENHIFTIGDFRSTATRAQVATSLVAHGKTTQLELAQLTARAELMLLAGMERPAADALIGAKIDSLAQLARAKAASLGLVLKDADPTLFEQWITAAQTFTGVNPAVEPRHIVAVNTNPPNLLLRLDPDSAFAAGPIARQLPAAAPVVIGTMTPQLTNDGIGYTLAGWSTGDATPVTTVKSTDDVVVTAKFNVACYAVVASAASRGGIVALSAKGNVAGFPANCFAPGTGVEIVATPEPGFVLKGMQITAGGTTRTVTTPRTPVVVDGPIAASATFMERPSTVSTILAPVAAGQGAQSVVFFTNQTPVAGFEVRIVDVRFQTTAGDGVVTLRSALPIDFGDLPAGGKTKEQQLAYDLAPGVTTFTIVVTVQLKNAAGDVFTEQRSIGHGRPGAGF